MFIVTKAIFFLFLDRVSDGSEGSLRLSSVSPASQYNTSTDSNATDATDVSMASAKHFTAAQAERLVNRLKNTNLEKFHTMCKMHLSFLLDLPGSSLEDFLNDGYAGIPSTPAVPASVASEKSTSGIWRKKKKAAKGKKVNAMMERLADRWLSSAVAAFPTIVVDNQSLTQVPMTTGCLVWSLVMCVSD